MEYALLVAAGLFAGYVNAMAGAGSLVTLPALVFSGLDPAAANATNRISILAQSATSGLAYLHGGVRPPRAVWGLCAVAASAAAAGAYVATLLDPDAIGVAIAVVMVVMLGLSFVRPPAGTHGLRITPATVGIFAVIGFYGGFLQAGAGVVILLVLALGGTDLVLGNAVKVRVILVLTVVAIATFAAAGATIDLPRGLTLAASAAAGGAAGAKAAVKRGAGFVRLALSAAVLASAAKLLWDAL